MVKPPKFTMKDVARVAQVSTSTVSAVLNGVVPVSPARRERVLKAMEKLDYQPDAIARSLKMGRSHVIGIVVPDITNAFYPEVIRGAEEAAQAAGYSVLLCNSNESAEAEERHISALLSRRVDGILLACSRGSKASEMMARRTVPVVYVDRLPLGHAGYNAVSTDNLQAGYLGARHLIELGHRRIALMVGNLGLSPHRDRRKGFRKAMRAANLPIRDEYMACGDVQVADGYAAGRRLLTLDDPPTAIMVSNSKLLFGLLQAIDERKTGIPDDLSVLAFDDYLWNRYFNPSLTAIAQQTHRMGSQALELLLEVIQKGAKASKPRQVLLPADLRVRASTASV